MGYHVEGRRLGTTAEIRSNGLDQGGGGSGDRILSLHASHELT